MADVGPPARVRFLRAPLGAEPALEAVIEAVDGLDLPFVLAGRWGLPRDASPAARVVIAGAVPSRLGAPVDAAGGEPGDPFAVLDDRPELVGDAPAGAVGGGWFGWLSYDLGCDVERSLGPQPRRPSPLPRVRMGWYDEVLRRDAEGVWWVEALASPDAGTNQTIDDAVERWKGRLAMGRAMRRRAPGAPSSTLGAMRIDRGAAAHRAAVATTVERIEAGEIFQANVCLRLEGAIASTSGPGRAAGLAARVLETTDPWFGGWIGGPGEAAIVSASPELFLRRRGREVTTGPIKGTAPREPGSTASGEVAAALFASEKDRAEHVMIVDLMRNDLGRVCDYGSVRYEATPRLEPHAGVWHLVSEVGGRLHDGLGDANLLRATFPPGSVTGAPKVQAMRVIAAVEGTGREVYTGAHGFVSPVAGLELGVTIRTIETDGARAWIGVGGGIVADSDPGAELAEALSKAAALVGAAGGTVDANAGPADEGRTVREPSGGARGAERSPIAWMRSADRRPGAEGGLLETIAVVDGRAQFVDAHVARLHASSVALGPASPEPDLADRIRTLAATATGPSRIRLLSRTRDLGPRKPALDQPFSADHTLELVPMVFDPAVPVDLAPTIVPGGLGSHKWLDRALVDDLTARLGATPLLLDADGTALEAGWANVWWLDGDTLCTPPADGRILPGVTRTILLHALRGPSRNATPVAVAVEERHAALGEIAALPLLLTSARGVSVARLPGTPSPAIEAAAALARRLAPLVVDAQS